MTKMKYEKYFVKDPKIVDWMPFHGDSSPEEGKKGDQHHTVYLDNDLVKASKTSLMINWINMVMPSDDPKNSDVPPVLQHTHPYDEILLFIGTNPDDLNDLGAVAELCMGPEREKHIIDTTTAVFIPKGLKHCPLRWEKKDRAHILVAISLNGEYV